MHRALFVAGGRYVLCSGDKSTAISMYDAETGATISRGDVGSTPTCAIGNDASGQVAISAGRSVALYALTPAKA